MAANFFKAIDYIECWNETIQGLGFSCNLTLPDLVNNTLLRVRAFAWKIY